MRLATAQSKFRMQRKIMVHDALLSCSLKAFVPAVLSISGFVIVVSCLKPLIMTSAVGTVDLKQTKKEHWTQRVNRENSELRALNNKLVEELRKQGSDIVIQVGPSSSSTSSATALGGQGGEGDEQRPSEDEDDSSDDSDDPDEPNDDPFSFDLFDKTITIHTKLNFTNPRTLTTRDTFTFHVRGNWKIRSISLLLFQKIGVRPNYFTYFNTRGDVLCQHMSFSSCGVSDYSTVHVGLSLKGGGKRANTSSGNTGSSSNPTATAKSKDEALNILEETLGVSIMRFNANPNASPVIFTINQKITQLVNTIKNDEITMRALLGGLSSKDLDKLLHINDGSSKVPVKCKLVADLCFSNDLRSLAELTSQTKLASEALPLGVHYLLTHFYGEPSGTISWSQFIDEVNAVIKDKAVAQAQADTPRNGLGL